MLTILQNTLYYDHSPYVMAFTLVFMVFLNAGPTFSGLTKTFIIKGEIHGRKKNCEKKGNPKES